MNSSKKSVAFMIIISVATVSTGVLMMLGIVDNNLASDQWRNQLHSEEATLADQLAESLALPLWNFDHDQMDKIMKSAMQNKNIYGIAVVPKGKNEQVYAKARDTEWRTVEADRAAFPDGMLLQEREIRFANNALGSVTIAATPKFTEAFLRYNRLVLVSILLLFNVILAACLYFVLWRWVVRPLREVEAFAVTVSSGTEDDWDVRTGSFYGEIESVRGSIAKMVEQLKTRYRALQKVLELRRASEERLQTVYDSINDAIIIHNATNGAIVDVNVKMCVMYGLTREEALQFNLGALSSGERPFTQRDALDKIAKAAAGEPQLFEWRARHKDGHLFWVEVNMKRAVIAGEDRVIVVVRDITQRKRAEEELQESERRYRTLFESAGDSIFIMRGEQIVDCNPSTLKMFACSREQILGSTPVRFSPPIQPDGLPSQEKALEKISAALTGPPQYFEWKHVRYDGKPFDAEVSLNKIDLGSGEDLQAIVRDVSERKRAEEELRLSEEKLRLILENAPYAVYVLGFDGRGLYVNKPAVVMSGYSREELLRMSFLDLVYPEDRDLLLQRREARLAGKQTEVRYSIRIVDRAGSVHWAENQVIVLPWEGEAATLNFLQDVTERKLAEDAIRKSEARFRGLIEKAPVAISISRDGRTIYVNHKYLELYGFQSIDELIGQPIFDQWAPESRELVRERAQKRARGEAVPSEYEGTGQRKDGSRFPVHIVVEQVELPDGPAFIAFLSDITGRKRAEETLQIRSQLLDRASDSIFLLDQDGGILYANEAASLSRGYGRDEMTLKNIRDLVPPGIAGGVGARIGEIFAKGEVVFESAHIRRDGTIFPVEIAVRAIEIGSMKYIISIVRDITERKQAEEALKKSEEMFSKLFMLAPVGIAFTSMADGRFVNVNNEFERVFGFSLNEAVGKTGTELGIWLDSKDRENIVRIIRTEGKIKDLDIRVRGKRGNIITWRYNAERVELNGQDYLLAASMDITKLKEGEEALREMVERITRSKKEWQDTFDSITDMISIHDRDFNVIRANKAFSAFVGMPATEVINRKCHELMHHGATAPLVGCPHQRTIREGVPVTDEVFDERTKRTFRVSTYPYYSPAGEIIGSIHIARDITEEKDREMGLIMNERLASLGQMASGIAHEINNPLEAVMICAEMLLMRVAKDTYNHAEFEKYLKIIDDEVLRCRDITSNMLSFSRQTTANRSDIDVHLLIDKAVDLLGYQGRLKNVTVTKKFGEQLLVSGNEGELRQVFLVLLINALDAMENRGALLVETRTEAGSAWVRISDTGPGIAPENIQKIFNPFFSTKTEKGGTGLGLSIAHRIIANHHGSLTVVSEPGRGAAFTVTLPR